MDGPCCVSYYSDRCCSIHTQQGEITEVWSSFFLNVFPVDSFIGLGRSLTNGTVGAVWIGVLIAGLIACCLNRSALLVGVVNE